MYGIWRDGSNSLRTASMLSWMNSASATVERNNRRLVWCAVVIAMSAMTVMTIAVYILLLQR